ncbi:ATP-binding protein [Treponema primitia]|nr:4Fe-4S dicluster domain-containing protein [Treponema primitia]
MIRQIVKIDTEKCNGCGICAEACHEAAIGIVDGKATLLRDDYCDGMGNCLPACPSGAIAFEEREAAAYDEKAVKANQAAGTGQRAGTEPGTGSAGQKTAQAGSTGTVESRLSQWPVQIKLAPVKAPFFDQARLLVSADCGAYAYGNFHNEFMKGRITLIGCPKLDQTDYSEKLTEIFKGNDIKSVTVVRMEVPCCGGIENAVIAALKNCVASSGKIIPWEAVTLSVKGELLEG